MKKRIFSGILVLVLLISIAGCKPGRKPTGGQTDTIPQTVPSESMDPLDPTTPPTQPTQPTDPVATEPTTPPTEPTVPDTTEPTEQPPYDPDATDPNNHTHSYAPTEVKNATCQEEGYAIYSCTGCEETFRSTLGIVPHDYLLVAETPATSVVAGTLTFACSYCGDSYTVEIPSDTPNE